MLAAVDDEIQGINLGFKNHQKKYCYKYIYRKVHVTKQMKQIMVIVCRWSSN